jgi:hypothetical protein
VGKWKSAMEEMELKNKKIVFCFPYREGPGGVNMLFLRLATYLKYKGYDTVIVDYHDGDMAKNRDIVLPLIPYYDDRKVSLPENSLLIFQSMTPWSIFPMLEVSEKSSVFFITTLPQNFYPLLPGKLRQWMSEGGLVAKLIWSTFLRRDISKIIFFISAIEKKNALAFLDEDIICNLQNSLSIKFRTPKVLPLFSQDVSNNRYIQKKFPNKSFVEIGWVGRLADFKINILNRVLQDAFEYSEAHQVKTVFHIIGAGEFALRLKGYESDCFSIKRINYIKPDELADYMVGLDIIFAMGTSALDAARIGMPTVRLDYSFRKVDCGYRYKMLYEAKGFSLGERIESDCFNIGIHSYDGVMNILKEEKLLLSKKCFDFYNENHSISVGAILFIKLISNTSLKWGWLKKNRVFESFYYNIWKFLRR